MPFRSRLGRHSAGWPLLLAALSALPAAAASPDVLYAETHTFAFAGGPGAALVEDVVVTITFVSERSTAETRFEVHEQYFNRVSAFEAEIDGREVRRRQFTTSPAGSADVFLSGGTIHAFTLAEAPEPGQRLTYRYRRTYPDAAYLPVLYVPNVDQLDRYEVVVRHPPDVAVAFDVASSRGEVPYQTAATDSEARVVFESLGEADEVPLFALNGFHAAVQVDLRRAGVALTPTRPDEFATWYGRLVAAVDTAAASDRLRALAAGLRRDTPEATVAAIHDHVRAAIRYVADERGENAFLPRAPDVVLDQTYGDCKDRAFLVAALARALGLRVDVVLAGTAVAAPTDGVSLGLYNHAINAFGEAGRRVYFDPTHPYLPFGALPESDLDGRALRLGDGATEDLRLAAQDTLPALDVDVRVSLDAPGAGEATVVARGAVLAAVREALDRGVGTDAVNVLSAAAGEVLYRIRLSALDLTEDRPDALTFRGRADLSQFVVASPTRWYLPQTPFRAVPAEVRERLSDAFDVDVPDRPHVRLRLRVAPGPWATAPAEVDWGGPEATFQAHVEPGPEGTTLTYLFRQRTRHFEGDARTAYLALADRYLGARRDVFTFQPSAE
jgi:hypothetical protein